MPIYEYVCENGHRFDVIHGIHDAGPTECPVCGSMSVRKAFAAPAIHFKGSGWAKKDRSTTSKPAASADAKASDTPAASDAAGGDTSSTSTTATKEPAAKPTPSTKGDRD